MSNDEAAEEDARPWDAGAIREIRPEFVDAAGDDFTLKPNSPAIAAGFRAMPFRSIGLYKDPDRALWPVPRLARKAELKRREWEFSY